MGRTYRTEGIILKRINLGETDRILTIYTKHYGKIRAIAKGVRKITSRKGGSVEAFNHVSLFLVQGKNLDIVSEVEVINSFKSWRKNLKKVGLSYYFCELVDRLTPNSQANRAVFELLKNYLARIGKTPPRWPEELLGGGKLVREFEEQLLEELGFGVPEALKNTSSSLKSYIETITESKITTPKILRQL